MVLWMPFGWIVPNLMHCSPDPCAQCLARMRCTACTFYTVIASLFVRDIQILSDMPLKD